MAPVTKTQLLLDLGVAAIGLCGIINSQRGAEGFRRYHEFLSKIFSSMELQPNTDRYNLWAVRICSAILFSFALLAFIRDIAAYGRQ